MGELARTASDKESLMESLAKLWYGLVEFIRIKHNSLVQFVGLVIATLVGFDLISWTDDQIALVLGLVTGFFVLFGSQTVTANARLTGKVFEGYSGADPNLIAAYELMKVSKGKPGQFVTQAAVSYHSTDEIFEGEPTETASDDYASDDYRTGGYLDDGPRLGER